MAVFDWNELVSEAEAPEAEFVDGAYTMVVDEAFYQTSKKGDPQFRLVLEVEGGPLNGRKIWAWLTAAASSDFSRRKFVDGLKAILGPDATVDLNNPDAEAVAAPLHGKRVSAIVKIEEREDTGEMRPNVKDLLPLKAVAPAPVAPAPAAAAAPAAASGETPPPPPA
jgi:hypothetical protein